MVEVVIDMTGRQVEIKKPVNRIISLVPSQTELLYFLGLGDKIAGQTVFCVHPNESFKKARKVGGTKKVRMEKIHELKPDLIICNKEENTLELVEELSKNYPVWVSDIKTIEDACTMMLSLGNLLEVESAAKQLVEDIKASFSQSKIYKKFTCLYLIWRKPYMTVGGDTFISHVLEKGGFVNICRNASRYPEINEEMLLDLRPELIFLSSEPYPFGEKHIKELQDILPYTKIMQVDGEMFSWYGNRLLNSQAYLNELQRRIHRGLN